MQEPPDPSRRAFRTALVLGALVLAWAATAVCGYRFGAADQVQYLVRVVAVADPDVLAGDPYLLAFDAIQSHVWDPIALLVPEGALPAAALALTVLCALASALGLASIARAILPAVATRGWAGALACLAPAAMLVVPKEQNWFGLVSLSDVEFTATLAAVPISVWFVALLVRSRVWWALLLGLAALPIQGQAAVYLVSAWVLAAGWLRRDSRAALVLIGAVGLAGAIAFLVVRAQHRVEPGAFAAYESVGAGLYAPLIDPTRAPAAAWAGVFAILALGAAAWTALARADGRTRELDALGVVGIAACVFPLLGAAALLVGIRDPLVWKLMVGRGLATPQIIALALVGVWGARRMHAGGARAAAAAGVLLAIGIWAFPALGAGRAAIGLALLLGVIWVDAWRPSGARGGVHRAPALALGAVLALPLALGVWAFTTRDHRWLAPATPDAWAETQRWARDNTPEGSVFVTPPYRAGWRVGSRRPTFGELRDGGLLFYAGEPVLAWSERMRTLGMTELRSAWAPDDAEPVDELRDAYAGSVRARAHELVDAGADYIVCEPGSASGVGVRVWSNDAFEVRSLGGSWSLGSDDAGP